MKTRQEFLPYPVRPRVPFLKKTERHTREDSCSLADSGKWFVKSKFDPKKWTIDIGSHFPELIAKQYDLLWRRFPYQLHYLASRLESSRQLLKLKNDWDGNGGTAFTEDHWRRVIRFLADNALWLWEREGLCMPEPRIVAGPERSIDVHWKSEEIEFLVNIPEDASLPANFYGDDYHREAINGMLDVQHDNFWLMLWLVGRN